MTTQQHLRQKRYTKGGQAFEDLLLETFQLYWTMQRVGDRETQHTGQSSTRWGMLGHLRDEGPLTVPQIARIRHMSRQGLQRIADELVAEGLARYAENPHHKRSKLLAITDRGLTMLGRLGQGQVIWANAFTKTMDAEHLNEAVATLRMVREAMEQGQ